MSSYSNYLGSKKCCTNNLAKTVTGSQGLQGLPGPIGPMGFQGVTGVTGPRGATGPCCRGPQGFTGPQGSTGSPGAAGGNGGLPLFLNFSIDGPSNTPTGLTPPTNATPPPALPIGYIPAVQAQQTTTGGQEVIYSFTTPTWTQDFMTTLSYSTPPTIPAGFYTLYLYAHSATLGWTIQYQIFTCDSTGTSSGNIVTPLSAEANVISTTNPPLAVIIPLVGSSVTLNGTTEAQLLLRLTFKKNTSTTDLYVHSENTTGPDGYSVLQTTFTVQGDTGAQGSTGAQGDTGPQGSTGIRGVTGAQGNTGPAGPQGSGGVLGYYGSFGNTAGFTATATLSAQPVYIGYVDGTGNNGVNLVGSPPYTYLQIDNPGVYNIQFSGQINKNSGGAVGNIDIWIEQNSGSGFVAIPASNTALQIPSNNQPHVAAWNWFIKTTNPNESIRLRWATDNTNLYWSAGAGLTGTPFIPSVILTVQQVMNTQIGATGTQGATGPSQWTNMNGLGVTGTGYTGIGVTGIDVLINGNLLVTGGIDPTYLALTPSTNGPTGLINPLWLDSVNGNALRSNNIYMDNPSINNQYISLKPDNNTSQLTLADGIDKYVSINYENINLQNGSTTSSIKSNANGNIIINTNTVAIGATSINSSAIIQADSTSKGFLPPRMTAIQANAISSPAEGLIIYVTNTGGSPFNFTSKGWWGYTGSTWRRLD